MLARFRPLAMAALLLAAAGCGNSHEGPVDIAIIGDEEALFERGIRLSGAAQHLRAATAEGLVTLDANGDIVPALADRWIVTEDGQSYIFRLRDGHWPDGSELTSQSVRTQMQAVIRSLRGTSLGVDLAVISEVRAMAGRVIEIRLRTPAPFFLQILAQPELGITKNGQGTGPMAAEPAERGATLDFIPPADRGLPQAEDWEQWVRQVQLSVLPGPAAVEMFYEGQVDIVLNGRLDAYPLLNTGPLSRGTIRLEPAMGLFGLEFLRPRGFLAEPANRAALSMAIDRDELLADFSLGGWVPATRLVAPGLAGDLGTIGERWQALTMEERVAVAAERVAAWRSDREDEASPEIALYLLSVSCRPGHRANAKRTSHWSTGRRVMRMPAGSSTSSTASCGAESVPPPRMSAFPRRWIRRTRPNARPCWPRRKRSWWPRRRSFPLARRSAGRW